MRPGASRFYPLLLNAQDQSRRTPSVRHLPIHLEPILASTQREPRKCLCRKRPRPLSRPAPTATISSRGPVFILQVSNPRDEYPRMPECPGESPLPFYVAQRTLTPRAFRIYKHSVPPNVLRAVNGLLQPRAVPSPSRAHPARVGVRPACLAADCSPTIMLDVSVSAGAPDNPPAAGAFAVHVPAYAGPPLPIQPSSIWRRHDPVLPDARVALDAEQRAPLARRVRAESA